MTPRSFTGELQVEDGIFQLHANPLIVRQESVRVRFSTFDDENLWADLEAEMPHGASGVYASGAVPNQYRGVKRSFVASLVLTRLVIEDDTCIVEGVWREAGEEYAFSGRLHEFEVRVNSNPTPDSRVGRWYDLERGEYPWQPGVYEVVGGHEPPRPVRGNVLARDYDGVQDRYAKWDGTAFGGRANTPAAVHRTTRRSAKLKDPSEKRYSRPAVDMAPRWWRGLSSPAV